MPQGFSLYQIQVYADPAPKPLTNTELDGVPPYNIGYYDQGDFAGIILPQPAVNTYYPECSEGKAILQTTKGKLCEDYITYSNVSTAPNGIDITLDVSKWMGQGLHTVYVTLQTPNGVQVDTTSLTLEYMK